MIFLESGPSLFHMGRGSPLSRYVSPGLLPLFLLTGYLGYIFYWRRADSPICRAR